MEKCVGIVDTLAGWTTFAVLGLRICGEAVIRHVQPMLNDMGHLSLQNYTCHLGTVLDVLGNSPSLWPTPSHLLPRLKTRPSEIHYQCSYLV
jgi:hypothetical protein